jgi:hypothetical protein
MTLPHFLIIGGMKCGSTTLYRDLLTHPRVFFPIDKEPCNLCHDRVLTPEGRAEYESLFKRARPDQLCAEASTDYTKLPDRPGVPARALQVLGPELKLIYLVRDPIKRLVSHHYHEYSRAAMPADIAQAVERHPELLNYSRYAMQLEPWLDAFDERQIRVVRFEAYIADRRAVVGDLQAFLGLDPRPELVETDKVHNKSEGKPIARGPMHALSRSGAYRSLIRPLAPVWLKDRLRRTLLPKAPPRPDPPTPELTEALLAKLEDDRRRTDELIARLGGGSATAGQSRADARPPTTAHCGEG